MTIPWAFFGVSVVGALLTLNAFVPVRRVPVLFLPSFFGSWLTAELALHHVVWQVLATVPFVYFGALSAPIGWVGLGICLASWAGLLVLYLGGHRAEHIYHEALAEVEQAEVGRPVPWHQHVMPFSFRRVGVRVTKHIPFATLGYTTLHLDVAAPEEPSDTPRPAVIQLHGGAWVIGDKREQGWPLIGHLAANGWVVFNANYRLSPDATFPDHLIDVKRAIAWVREHAEEWNVDPDFIAITGGSAGGHLASLAALTANEPIYQPGFEDSDTSVQACVPIYGVYDFTNRLGIRRKSYRRRLIDPIVMKTTLEDEPEAFAAASPVDQVHRDAPPFLVIHGDRDVLSPVEDARMFVERLRAVSREPVYYAELRGAQHAFDVFCSPRTLRTVTAVHRFLVHERARHEGLAATEPVPAHAMAVDIVQA